MAQRPVCGNLVEWELGEGRPGTLVWVVGQARALRVPWCCLGAQPKSWELRSPPQRPSQEVSLGRDKLGFQSTVA